MRDVCVQDYIRRSCALAKRGVEGENTADAAAAMGGEAGFGMQAVDQAVEQAAA